MKRVIGVFLGHRDLLEPRVMQEFLVLLVHLDPLVLLDYLVPRVLKVPKDPVVLRVRRVIVAYLVHLALQALQVRLSSHCQSSHPRRQEDLLTICYLMLVIIFWIIPMAWRRSLVP